MKDKILSISKTLIRIACMTLAFALPLSWVGLHVSGGIFVDVLLGALSVGAYSLSADVVRHLLGIPKGSCPIGSAQKKMMLQVVACSFAQVALAALLPFVALGAWWTVLAGGPILLVFVILTNFPTTLLSKAFAKEQ